ncbi:hypothetical protein BDN72DRAFT_890540 [Pluteus cervinus]|uniref:Uncharacterized protein n=1 Tax=Pluteus cervinus TaxID=181527 RepID=A0ACD3BGE7_9AGAR|nr:hypothetical protein BDN72DRAFT_890540 [Pluteus cervinus]
MDIYTLPASIRLLTLYFSISPWLLSSMSREATFLVFSTFFRLAECVLVNATIDDTVPDPISGATISYSPAAAWNDGPSCQNCTAHPDPNQMISGTWHDATFNPQPGSNNFPNTPLFATTTFTGSAVYVICALAQSTNFPAGNSDMTFFIDNDLVGTFELPAPGGTGYAYRVPVYSNTSLEPGRHQITIQNGHANGPKSLILLDAVIYSFNEEPSTPQPPPSSQPPPQQFAPLPQSAPSPSQNSPPSSSNSSPPSPNSPPPSLIASSQQSTSASAFLQTIGISPSQQAISSSQGLSSLPHQSKLPKPTQPSSQLSARSRFSRVGVIVGLVVGGLVILGLIAALFYYHRRRQRQVAPGPEAANMLNAQAPSPRPARPARPDRPTFIPAPFVIPPTFPLQDGGNDTRRQKPTGRSTATLTPLSTQRNNQSPITGPVAGSSTRVVGQHPRQISPDPPVSATTVDGSRPLIRIPGPQPRAPHNNVLEDASPDSSPISRSESVLIPLLWSTPPPAYEGTNAIRDSGSVLDISPQAAQLDRGGKLFQVARQ